MDQLFIYRARNAQNQLVTGKVRADNMEAAKKILASNNLLPLNITVPKTASDYLPFRNRVGLKDKTMFARQLATMLEAGLTLSQALRLIVRQTPPGYFQRVLSTVLNDIQDGFSFSTALAKFPDVFDSIFINVVRAGEATGKLDIVLLDLAQNLEKDVKIRGKIRGAMVYPAFILLVMVLVAIVIVVKVIPQLKEIFLSSNQQLPASTQALIALSNFVINYWYAVIFILILAVLGIRAFVKTPSGTKYYSQMILRLPLVGSIAENASMGRFGRMLGMLLGSGVPLLEALRLVSESFTNQVHKEGISTVTTQVERGVPMSATIAEIPAFPLMVGQMVAVGEQTGKLDEVMTKMAEYYEGEVESKVGGISSLIEPMVLIILGLGVAWLVQAVLLPIYQISSTAG